MQNLLIANFWGVLQATLGEFSFIFGILGEGWVILWSLSQRLASLWLDWFDDIPSFVATCFFCFDVAVVRTVRGFYNSWTVLLISLTGRKRRPLIQQPWLLIGCAYTTWCWIRNLQYHTYRSGVILIRAFYWDRTFWSLCLTRIFGSPILKPGRNKPKRKQPFKKITNR